MADRKAKARLAAAVRRTPFAQRTLAAPVKVAKPPKPPAQIITPAGIEVQRGKSHTHDPRFQCDPKERIAGGFASMGPGRYLDTEGPLTRALLEDA